MRGDLFGYGETRSGGGRLGLQLQAGSARLTAVLDVLVLTSEGRGHNSQTHRLTVSQSSERGRLALSSKLGHSCFLLGCPLVASYEPGFRWCDWTSRFRYATCTAISNVSQSPPMPCWHDAAAMFNSLKPGSSPVHQVVEVPVRLFQRTNLFFQAYCNGIGRARVFSTNLAARRLACMFSIRVTRVEWCTGVRCG
jgi:hypothetical protein